MGKETTAPKKAGKINKKAAIISLIAAVCVITAAVICVALMIDNGVFLRLTSVRKSDSLSVNAAMMTYFYWDTVDESLTGEYAETYASLGLTSRDGLDGKLPSGMTFRDYFKQMTRTSVEMMLDYAQYALDEGYDLTADDRSLIDGEIEKIGSTANMLGKSEKEYISSKYGRGVGIGDIRDALRIVSLYNKGVEIVYAFASADEKEVVEYFNAHTDDFTVADYYFFIVGVSGPDSDMSPEQRSYYSTSAEYISNSASEEEFISRVRSFVKAENADKPADELSGLIDAEIEDMTYIGAPKGTSDLNAWVFDKSRAAGDIYLNHADGYGTYGLIYIIRPAYVKDDWYSDAENAAIAEKVNKLIDGINEKYPADLTGLSAAIADVK